MASLCRCSFRQSDSNVNNNSRALSPTLCEVLRLSQRLFLWQIANISARKISWGKCLANSAFIHVYKDTKFSCEQSDTQVFCSGGRYAHLQPAGLCERHRYLQPETKHNGEPAVCSRPNLLIRGEPGPPSPWSTIHGTRLTGLRDPVVLVRPCLKTKARSLTHPSARLLEVSQPLFS